MRLPTKSKLVSPIMEPNDSFLIQRRRSAMSKKVRLQNTAVNIDMRMPRNIVTPNPLIGPVPTL